jgi:hemolysin-activating ACP:hemolysin acyltransferase
MSAKVAECRMSVAERLGWAVYVICRRGCYIDYPLGSLSAWLLPAAQLEQLHVFVDDDKKLLGYMTWAWFGEETEHRWVGGSLEMLHISEWNEGNRLWIIDFVTMPGYTELCMRMAPYVFPQGVVGRSLGRHPNAKSPIVTTWTREDKRRRSLRRQRL